MDGAALVIWVITGIIAAAIASAKGRNVVGWFFMGFFFSLIGIIIVACLSNLKEEQAYRDQQNRENRRLREQLRQERLKAEAFRQHAFARLDAHDQQLGVDTRQTYAALPMHQTDPQPLLENQPQAGELGHQPMADPLAQAPYAAQPQPYAAQQSPYSAQPSPAHNPAQPAPRQWHYEANGQAQGPVPEPQLLAMLRAGQIHNSTLLWTEELGDWKAAGQISALRPYLKR